MGKPSSRPPDLAIGMAAALAAVALLTWMSPAASMALAVVSAVCWCVWLDHHPTS